MYYFVRIHFYLTIYVYISKQSWVIAELGSLFLAIWHRFYCAPTKIIPRWHTTHPTKSETSVVSSSPPEQTLPHPRPAEPIWSLARLLALRRVPRSSSAMADQSARSDHSGAPRFPSLLPLLLCLSISVTLALDGL
jgi:hypothetical protein